MGNKVSVLVAEEVSFGGSIEEEKHELRKRIGGDEGAKKEKAWWEKKS